MSNDNELPPVTTKLHPDFGDIEAMLNIRTWLEDAVTKAGAKVTGDGCGMGQSDVDISLEGFTYYISIKPAIKGEEE